MTVESLVAAVRFGLGPKPGELRARRDRAALRADLAPQMAAPAPRGVPATGAIVAAIRDATRRGRERDVVNFLKGDAKDILVAEVAARTRRAVETETPFHERLVQHWSNHFTVSLAKPIAAPLLGAFEREAILPHVTGRFVDLLRAASLHPAMMIYLDQATSIGPNSRAGRRRDLGLNENLAREMLELHTLGVDGGYGQEDVVQLARILTGWTVDREGAGAKGRFMDILHEPGDKRLLGQRIAEAGPDEVEAAFQMLARHPSTARNVATRLARHFVADDPSPTTVERLARVFRDTEGDLRAVGAALVDEEAIWRQPLSKVKTPNDLVQSIFRLIRTVPDGTLMIGALKILGQQPFSAPSPKGWSDRAADWITPDALLRRIEMAQKAAARLGRYADGTALLDAGLGAGASGDLAAAVRRAGDRTTSVALVLASAEFQRR